VADRHRVRQALGEREFARDRAEDAFAMQFGEVARVAFAQMGLDLVECSPGKKGRRQQREQAGEQQGEGGFRP